MTDAAPDTGTSDATDTSTGTEGDTPTIESLQAEVDKWKATSRKHEERAKTNATAAKELDRLRQESMTEQEQAVAAARNEARIEALREAGSRLVDAEVKVAAAGRNVDIDALLEGLDRTRFLDDDGAPDPDAIKAWVDRIAPQKQENDRQPPAFPDLGQGPRPDHQVALGDPVLDVLKSTLGIP